MKTINVNPLSLSSINKAIKELEAYEQMLKEFPSKYTRALSEYLNQTLGMEAPHMTNHWILDFEEFDDKVSGIFIFDGMVQFIEFGTGYIGLSLHEGINPDWLSKLPPPYNVGYNTGTMIRNKQDPENSYWVFQKDGQYYTTHGQKADPFIYRSVQQLLDARASIARQVLGNG